MKSFTLYIALLLIFYINTDTYAQQSAEHRLPFIEAEIFSIDQAHSTLEFSIGFLGLTDVKGTFDDYSATVLYNEQEMSKTAIILRIDVASIDTGSDFRDKDLQGEQFFDAENHPEIIFKSKRIKEKSDGAYLVTGDLTIKGVTREISLPVSHVLKRTEDSAWGNVRMGFSGQTTINRLDYDVHGGDFWGLKALAEKVHIEFMLLGRIHNLVPWGWRAGEKPSIGEEMEKVIEKDGIKAALAFYEEVKTSSADEYNFAARELNLLARKLKQKGEIEDALKICEIYLEAYPESAAAHTLHGELLAIREDLEGAKESFERVLELDPEDDLSKMVLKRLNKSTLNK